MLLTALDIFMTIYQGALLTFTIKRQFRQCKHSILYEIGSILLYTLYILSIQYLEIPIPDSLSIFVPFLYILLTSHEKTLTCVLWTILDGFLFFGTLTLVSSVFTIQIDMNGTVLSSAENVQIIYYFVGNAAVTVVLNVAARFVRVNHIISIKETILFIFMLLVNFAINECFFLARIAGKDESVLVIGAACSFLLMMLTMLLYDRLTNATWQLWQSRFSAQTNKLVAEHQKELEDIYKNMLSQQHDLRHRVTAAEEILSASVIGLNEREQVLSLLKESTPPTLYTTGCISVDAILKAKSAVMEKANINFKFIEYPLLPLPIPEEEFCMILGNLLDNAIEGVHRLSLNHSSRQIILTFSRVWQMLFITCENDADETKIKRVGDEFISSKTHPELHGFGTKNMVQTVSRYGGTIDFEVKDGKFLVQIMLSSVQADNEKYESSFLQTAS